MMTYVWGLDKTCTFESSGLQFCHKQGNIFLGVTLFFTDNDVALEWLKMLKEHDLFLLLFTLLGMQYNKCILKCTVPTTHISLP